jgi:hypothetical protein
MRALRGADSHASHDFVTRACFRLSIVVVVVVGVGVGVGVGVVVVGREEEL